MVSSSDLEQVNLVKTDLAKTSELDLFSLPLTGRSLIEASAGTGKTYSLAFIYLRLLLGIGDNSYNRPLSVEEILVVTFTTAATQELRYRIRQNISQLRNACLQGYHADSHYQCLLDLIDDKALAAKRLFYAQQNMDKAAIFTIHSFCQRQLTTYAFESGSLFNKTLIKDQTPLYLQEAENFWRKYFTPMPADIAQVIWQHWADPTALLTDISPYLNRELPQNSILSPEPLSDRIKTFHHNNISKINAVKLHWLSSVNDIEVIITQSGVSKQSYTKRNLPRWLEKVSYWAMQPTKDYLIPTNELGKFSQTELKYKTEQGKTVPVHPLFDEIDQLLSTSFNFRNAILFDVINIIRQKIQKQKAILAQMSLDDLLNDLKQALYSDNGHLLAKQIITQYPATMIDEFQDTDPIQYQIFDYIYKDKANSLLLFIGDPKQAIYAFRGGDIFTYIKAKSSATHLFTMSTNWRSTPQMVEAINSLFSRQKNPFIFQQIPFIHINSTAVNSEKAFCVDDKRISAFNCYLLPETVTTSDDYLENSAQYCAEQICQWLSADSYFTDFVDGQVKKRKVTSADIAILVRKGREAQVMAQALNKRNIKSVYLSNHHSVFSSLEARETLRILQAALMPYNESYLRSALATRLIGASMADIDRLSFDQALLETWIEEFCTYQETWLNYGVLVMLRRLMNQHHLAENLLSMADGERIITNFMHLGELLQEISQEQDTPHAQIRWLTKQISNPDRNIANHEQRLESDENLISIITIHKSKGLEYPIVFLPFIGRHHTQTSSIYHDPKSHSIKYAYDLSPEIKQLIEQERLAEDLRLLYVALTRSIYHCSFVLAGLKKGRSNESSLIRSAMGYLLLDQAKHSYLALTRNLTQLAQTSIFFAQLPVPVSYLVPETKEFGTDELDANVFKRKLDHTWRVSSYSGLLRSSLSYDKYQFTDFTVDILPPFDTEVLADTLIKHKDNDVILDNKQDINQSVNYNIHHFPKGSLVGTLLHECFEKIDFISPDISLMVELLVSKLNLDENWIEPISQWFNGALHSPLMPEHALLQLSLSQQLSLSKLSLKQRLNELPFYLPIRREVTANKLDQLCKRYDLLSRQCEALNFATVKGMLKGFIDMIFKWQDKYYLVDYKSNYLGQSVADYSQASMQKAICEHRYDLQYQLYTLALHRYLQSRIPHYKYQTHFGGVFYLFIRGMSETDSHHGIFYTKPDSQFIAQLDELFG